MNPSSTPPRVQDNMVGSSNSTEGVLSDFLMLIIPKIVGEPAIESIINIHRLISIHAAYVASNLRGAPKSNLLEPEGSNIIKIFPDAVPP